MAFKTLTGLIGLALLVVFLLPPIVKLKKLALAVIVLFGLAMAAFEFYESVRKQDR